MWAMRASRTLPDGYVHGGVVTLARNRRLAVLLNLAGIPWMVVCGTVYVLLAALVRPGGVTLSFDGVTLAGFLGVLIGGAVATTVLVLLLHEATHGLVFWLFTRSRPTFGFKGWYAYASAPGWHLTRGRFLAVLLAPIVVLTVAGLPLVAFGPPVVALFTLLGLIGNATSAIGDMYMCLRLLRVSRSAIVEDQHDGITWYVPAARSGGAVSPAAGRR
jgi:hypothetical protein